MLAATFLLRCDAGASFPLTLTITDSAGALLNTTGYTGRMLVKANYDDATEEAVLTLTTENGGMTMGGSNGVVSIFATAAQTEFDGGTLVTKSVPNYYQYFYDIEITSPASLTTRLMHGEFRQFRQVSTS